MKLQSHASRRMKAVGIDSGMPSRCGGAFTLTELLVAIAGIAVLLALLFPAFRNTRESAKTAACMDNQRQIVSAILMYAGDNGGRLPPFNSDEKPGRQWNYLINRYLNVITKDFVLTGIDHIRCPSGKEARASYGVNYSLVFNYEATGKQGSMRLQNLSSSAFLLGDCAQKSTVSVIYTPEIWTLNTDFDKDGTLDSHAAFSVPYNYFSLRHDRKGVVTLVDGSCKLLSAKDWATNKDGFWGPKQVW